MAYVDPNFKTKKSFKEAVDRRVRYLTLTQQAKSFLPLTVGHAMAVQALGREFPAGAPARYCPYNPSMPQDFPRDGRVYIEGPHYPEPHRWYAQCEMKDGEIISVK